MHTATVLLAILVIGTSVAPGICQAEGTSPRIFLPETLDMNITTLPELAAKLHQMEYVPGRPGLLVFGTGRGFVYLYHVYSDGIMLKAKTNLWKGIKKVALADLDRDGKPEVLALTKEAMLYVLDLDQLKIMWSTEEGYFEGVACFTVADLGQNGENEIIILADEHLFVFDIGSGYERWKSLVEYEATHIVAGDVDGDGMMELLLSDGTVLDSRLYEEEWIYEQSLGHCVDLYDIDGDGVLEVVSVDGAGDIQIIDIDDRARKWQ